MALSALPSAKFDRIAPAGFALLTALGIVAFHNADVIITSACDGAHSGPDDPHHLGCAYDVRSHNFAQASKDIFLRQVLGVLGQPSADSGGYVTDKFFGWLEGAGTPNEHFHFQLRHGQEYP